MVYDSNSNQKRHRNILGRCIALALVMLVALLVAVVLIDRNLSQAPETPQLSSTQNSSSATSRPTEPTEPVNPTDTIQLVFGGDLVVNDAVVQAGLQDGRYDYTGIFMDIVPVLSGAHGAAINFEGNSIGFTVR